MIYVLRLFEILEILVDVVLMVTFFTIVAHVVEGAEGRLEVHTHLIIIAIHKGTEFHWMLGSFLDLAAANAHHHSCLYPWVVDRDQVKVIR